MTTKVKTFDCVQMKTDIQAKLLAEYQARKQEFSCYADFIRRKGEESKWVKRIEESIKQG